MLNYKYHYVYRITNIITKMYYYGDKSCVEHPSENLGKVYFSSFSNKYFEIDQKLHPEDYEYKVIKIFRVSDGYNRKDAKRLEVKLHKKFDVKNHPKFINRANQTSSGFEYNWLGKTQKESSIKKRVDSRRSNNIEWTTEETKEKMRGERPNFQGVNASFYGKHHTNISKIKIGDRDYSINSTTEARNKISIGLKKTIKERGVHWSKGVESKRKDISMIEEYGKEKSNIIMKKMSDKAKNRTKGECIYCGKVMDISNLGKYHNENCINHSNKEKAKENLEKTLSTCPYCGKTGKKAGMKQWHFDRCKLKENK